MKGYGYTSQQDGHTLDKLALTVDVVPTERIWNVWAYCVPHIKRVVEESKGQVSMGTTLAKLSTGNAVLITISEGDRIVACNVLEVRTLSDGTRALYITITGGSRFFDWMDDFEVVVIDVAKRLNCTELRGMSVREGWMMVLDKKGWEAMYTEIRYEIKGDT